MATSHIRFNKDIDHYEPSDSEDEYTEKEKQLLKKTRSKPAADSDSEEEVFGLNAESSEDDNSDIADSDIEGQDDDDLPDVRAWGKTKKDFYSTDYVDQDYGGYQGKDATAADFEEEEAKNIQKRLAEQLDDDDFSLEIFDNKPESEDKEKEEEIIKSDLSALSKRELLQLLQKESPEFFVLIDDFKAKMSEVKSFLQPIIQQEKEGKIPDCDAMNFVHTMYHLILNYCTNIYMYLLLKASKVNVKNHPVLKRLYQYRQLISQLEPIYNEIIRPQLEVMIEMAGQIENSDEKSKDPVKKSKKLKLLQKIDSQKASRKKSDSISSTENEIKPPTKRSKLEITKSILKSEKNAEAKHVSFDSRKLEREAKEEGKSKILADSESDEEEPEENGEEVVEESVEEGGKRAITYQMAKNKGLTPHRKKEQRNPRVKHRNKFRKAKIRRKGAVREVRTETSRYGGEISGIKASVSKSIKFK
ncbi:Something about silencing 10 [Carabus blaptoides fortunei]